MEDGKLEKQERTKHIYSMCEHGEHVYTMTYAHRLAQTCTHMLRCIDVNRETNTERDGSTYRSLPSLFVPVLFPSSWLQDHLLDL